MKTGSGAKFSAQLEGFIHLVSLTLDEEARGADLAADACLSRHYFQRLFVRTLGEPVVAFRRRLLMERAAHQLTHTAEAITELAFATGYESLEGFSRAFRRLYGKSPSEYRRQRPAQHALPGRSGIHYSPGGRGPQPARAKGIQTMERTMDLTDRLVEHDQWLTRRLLEGALTLTDAQLDAPVAGLRSPLPFEADGNSLRSALTRLVTTKEIWVSAIEGLPLPERGPAGIAELIQRLDPSGAAFAKIVLRVRDEGRWDETFTDALCTPAETFTYGGMIAHVLTFSAYRRQAALKILEEIGVKGLGYGDPIEWERQIENIKK